jgi:hypothetical protein
LKQAIDYVDQSWSGVTTTTIKNCWGKTGILPDGQNSQTNSVVNEDYEFVNPFNNQLINDDYQQALVHQVEEYIIVNDEPLVIEDTLSDIEIVEMVLEDAQIEAGANVDSDEDDEELPPPIVTIKEAYEALKKLIRFEEQQNEINNSMDKLKIFRKYLPHYEKLIDKSKIQPKIDSYIIENNNIDNIINIDGDVI